MRTRTCNNPKPVNTDEGCEGPKNEAVLCKDDKVYNILIYQFIGDSNFNFFFFKFIQNSIRVTGYIKSETLRLSLLFFSFFEHFSHRF